MKQSGTRKYMKTYRGKSLCVGILCVLYKILYFEISVTLFSRTTVYFIQHSELFYYL